MTDTQTGSAAAVLTYHGDPDLKARLVTEAHEHRRLDRYQKGLYLDTSSEWWRGCAVGCTTAPLIAESLGTAVADLEEIEGWHLLQEQHAGIPMWLGCVQDKIFEGLPDPQAYSWPGRFLEALPVGVDVTRIRDAFLRDIVLDPQQGAFAYAANALDAAGLGDHARRLRNVPRDCTWSAAYADAAAAASGAWEWTADRLLHHLSSAQDTVTA
jgi:hypothetical protein